ncbi:hypothetical protein, conserved [Eimeria praecox]|uniref:Uncharacterized protein n=1 Tax=Eimeria praecox TaxID=51316 RepID=U6H782_9EIME|nr:hypothetical protein, conserved [Eimeria praecox]
MGWLEHIKRDLLRRGSPAFRVGVWVTGIAGGLVWIYFDERDKPIKERAIFLPARRQVPMDASEIEEWNQKLSGGKLLPLTNAQQQQQQQQQQQGVEAARAALLAAVKEEAQQQEQVQKLQQQKEQGWISNLLGLNEPPESSGKKKKVPLLFDK